MASRREFGKVLVLAALSGAPPTSAATQEKSAAEVGGAPLADALVEVVRAQSGAYLNAEDLTRVRADFKDYVPFLERLRQFKLTNADEPDVTFSAVTRRWL
jgi:hypothetical protein